MPATKTNVKWKISQNVVAPLFGMCFIVRMTAKSLIDQLGGISAVSEATGAKKGAVANWRLAGRTIPWKHRPVIARLAAERAINLPTDFWGAQ
jgi:hypothetical protein